MKKSLVLVMALVLVVAFAFADEVGRATLGTDKGVITAGDPLNVSFTLSVEDVAEDVTTIEVMGDEVADNVFVMLIKDLPNEDATYEAQKVVDPDAQKTTYYIKAKELVGTLGNIYAELRDWNGEVVASATKEFAWKGTTWTDTLQLVPEVEGLYTVVAYIEFADGTRMELKGWEGYAQLVALDKYVKETIPGLAAELQDADGNTVEYGAANSVSVSAGVEFMYAKASESETGSNDSSDDKSYLGVYGEGSESAPSVAWTWSKNGKPEFADVELVYQTRTASSYNSWKTIDQENEESVPPSETDSAYIKFKVMQESFEEGDCCATAGDPKWALWFAIGTGEYHTDRVLLYQEIKFHLVGSYIFNQYRWRIWKGAECKGWVKAIFYLDPSDIEMWLYAVLGTTYEARIAGASDYVEGDSNDASGYSQNFLTQAELNLMTQIKIKDVIMLDAGLLNIPVTKTGTDTDIRGYLAANVSLSGDVASIDLGGSAFTTNVASAAEAFLWTGHLFVSGLDLSMANMFPVEALNNVRLGMTLAGDQDGFSGMTLLACFEPDITCCVPSFKVGLDTSFDGEERTFEFNKVFAEYTHDLGTYGPVSLSGTLGGILALNGYVDCPYTVNYTHTTSNGADWWDKNYATGQFGAGGDTGFDWALGLAYEVTGTMTW